MKKAVEKGARYLCRNDIPVTTETEVDAAGDDDAEAVMQEVKPPS